MVTSTIKSRISSGKLHFVGKIIRLIEILNSEIGGVELS